MFADGAQPIALSKGEGAPGDAGHSELLCLLRLHEIALADPPPVDGLRAMVDEIVRLPSTFRAVAAVPDGRDGRLRYLAHVGVPGVAPHQPLQREPTPMAVQALSTGQLVQLMRSDGGAAHGCVNLPINGGDGPIGFLGLGVHLPVPLEPWREQAAWAMADLMALLLLNHRGARTRGKARSGPNLDRLTERQREVLYELVERGSGNTELGERFRLSPRTIKIHLMAAYRELGVHSRAEAVRAVHAEHAGWLAQQRAMRRQRVAAS
jgi:DNA-binding CsgD family transcriptional regulator